METATWIAAIATVIAAAVAIPAAVIARSAQKTTADQLDEMRNQTRLQQRALDDAQKAYVWVDWRLDPISAWLVDLVVKNEGPTVAENITITADPPICRSREFGHQANTDHGTVLLPRTLTSLPPGREMRWTLGSHVKLAEEGDFTKHHVTISYDTQGERVTLAYDLDYGDGDASAIRDPGNLKDLTKTLRTELRKMNTAIQRAAGPGRTAQPDSPSEH